VRRKCKISAKFLDAGQAQGVSCKCNQTHLFREARLGRIGLAKQKLFGMVALSMGIITKKQLDECVAIQQESIIPRRLGAVLLARGYVTEGQVREILSIQGKSGETTNLPASKSERKRLLGDILIEHGYINRQTLTAALERQRLLRRTGINPRLGEILIAIGKITNNQLKEALVTQATA
jgi:hypothetical protein